MTRNARIGLVLFGVYLLIYGGFVLINAFSPAVMEQTPIPGVSLAILYGFALIIIAFVLSLLYGVLCRSSNEPKKTATQPEPPHAEEVQG